MSLASENAALRIMLRAMAPNIKETFVNASKALDEPIGVLYLIMGHKVGGDLNNPHDSVIQIKSSLSKATINLQNDPNKKDQANENTLAEIFPVAAELIGSQASEWDVTPFDVYLWLCIKPSSVVDGEFKAESIDLRIKTKKYVIPFQEQTVA